MQRSMVLKVVLAFASVWVLISSAVAAVWLTAEVRVAALVMLPTVVVASLLVLYFEWRMTLKRRLLADVDELIDWDQTV